ncbi:alpha/beta-hydrolase [Clavulina sp. PMI_390]|nr:alpha/beta-hydrolase [Clavulina sp. PMI_390]
MAAESIPSSDPPDHVYERPADRIRTIDVPRVPQRIFDDLKMYEDNARGFGSPRWERMVPSQTSGKSQPTTTGGIFLTHRPADAKVAQKFRIPISADGGDPNTASLERLTYFDIGTGRTISSFLPVLGDDWRGGQWRSGGAIMVMDLDGSEKAQIWRYWEDDVQPAENSVFPRLTSELDNAPGRGRIERVTHNNFRNDSAVISSDDRFLAYSSNRENGRDTLIYIHRLKDSNTQHPGDDSPFDISSGSYLITPLPPTSPDSTDQKSPTLRWTAESFSPSGTQLIIMNMESSSKMTAHIVDISNLTQPGEPRKIVLPGVPPSAPGALDDMTMKHVQFGQTKETEHLVYMLTNAYGDFESVVIWDSVADTVRHITTPSQPGSGITALSPIPWDTAYLRVTPSIMYFRANVHGWHALYAMPLTGPHAERVFEIELLWGGGDLLFSANHINGRDGELVLRLKDHLSSGWFGMTDVSALFKADLDLSAASSDAGPQKLPVRVTQFAQATPPAPTYETRAPELLLIKSFDGLEVPVMYYPPVRKNSATGPVSLIINIHGGPASQAGAAYRHGIHDYVLNEMNCALMYPNVRGSSGYGKTYMAADDVEKREDSVRDIGAILEYVRKEMKESIDGEKIAVMGGSYGGYMVFATLVHYSSLITCALARFGISHWPSFLKNTSPHRQDHRRAEYGDERDPRVLEILERISPISRVDEIAKPMMIAHGENDTRVPLSEAMRMWDGVKKRGVVSELVVCEGEGHGDVIEYTNAATVYFFERFLLAKPTAKM